MNAGAEDALAQARRLLAADGEAVALPAAADALGVAWALKDLCYEAWHNEPAAAVRAADALARLRDGVPPQAEIAALAAWTAGIARLTRGEMAQAVPLFDAAAAGLREAGKPDPAAQTQVPKIMALSMLGDHAAAAACGETTQRELRALGNLRAAARVSLNLGNLQMLRDAYPQAARQFREAAVLFARLGDHVYSVMADIGLADTYSAMGDFDEALRVYARAGMRAGSRGLELQQALVEESVALLDLARGRYRDSLTNFESARRRYESLGVPHYMAIAEKQLGDAYLELRLLPEAMGLFETAVKRFRALQLPLEEARALTQLGSAQARLGLAAADDTYAAAAGLFASSGNLVGEAAVALARAELWLGRAQPAQALPWARLAAGRYAEARHADGQARAEVLTGEALLGCGSAAQARTALLATLERARAQQLSSVQVRCLTALGLAALAEGDGAGAAEHFEAAIDMFEVQRRALPGDDIRSAFLSGHLRPYEECLRLALARGGAEDVLWHLDRFRARALEERLAEGERSVVDPGTQALRDRLNWLYRRVHRLHDEGAEVPATLAEEVSRVERTLLEHARRQRLAAPMTAGAEGGAGAPDVRALQNTLAADEALVEFGVQGDELFACVVTAAGVRLRREVARWPEVLEAVRAARFQIESLRHGRQPVHRHMDVLVARSRARLQRLHALLWQPLADLLAGCRRVLVAPHGVLALVPFAALMDEAGVPLGQRLELALVPSARAAMRAGRPAGWSARTVLAIGESSRLPHAAVEVEQVAQRFAQRLVFVGDAATVQALQRHAGEADVVHLACHAQFRGDSPRFSALHLVDGALTVEAAEELRLGGSVVVLSACETGMAQTSTGDEMVGLVRAFMLAGASRVVASLWPVDDEVTVSFMDHFYRAMVGGAGPAAALQAAQSATMSLHPHPSFWGAFVVYGGW